MTVLPWQMSVWLTVVPCGGVCVYIGVYITQAHRHSITLFRFLHCEGAVSAATEQQQTRILSFHQFYKVESLSLSLSLSQPLPSQAPLSAVTQNCQRASLTQSLSTVLLSFSLSRSYHAMNVEVHLVTQTSPVSRGELLHNWKPEYSEYFLVLHTARQVAFLVNILDSKYLNIRGRQSWQVQSWLRWLLTSCRQSSQFSRGNKEKKCKLVLGKQEGNGDWFLRISSKTFKYSL